MTEREQLRQAERGPRTCVSIAIMLHQHRLKSQYLLDMLCSVLVHAGSLAPQYMLFLFLEMMKCKGKKERDRVDPAILEAL